MAEEEGAWRPSLLVCLSARLTKHEWEGGGRGLRRRWCVGGGERGHVRWQTTKWPEQSGNMEKIYMRQ